MTSPPRWFAKRIPSSLFPEALVPSMTTSFCMLSESAGVGFRLASSTQRSQGGLDSAIFRSDLNYMLRVSRGLMLSRQVLEVRRSTMVRAGAHDFSGRVSSTCPRSSNCVTEGELPRAPKLVHLVAEIRARGHARPSCPVL